jgi:hypothetical protein
VRVLLDECLPRRLKVHLAGHEVRTDPEMGWASRRNGDLLALAAGPFDVFLTVECPGVRRPGVELTADGRARMIKSLSAAGPRRKGG